MMSSLLKFLSYSPVELRFGTSGLRGLVVDMTDLECYINTVGFLRYLRSLGELEDAEPVYLAGDLRDSTPRILKAVMRAVRDEGSKVVYCGLIPTPALACYAFAQGHASIMVTGSHIPSDRNGIKFYKRHDEVLKENEVDIKEAVAQVRADLYGVDAARSLFDAKGMLKTDIPMGAEVAEAREHYQRRFENIFTGKPLAGYKVVMYQHSAVGRDIIVDMLEHFGAEVIAVGRSDVFVAIDSENVTEKDQEYFARLAAEHAGCLAIVSTDGDSDRPFVIDERGIFHRGDVLGAVVAQWMAADAAAFPVSTSDAVTSRLDHEKISWTETKIGSPYVISAMKKALECGMRRVVGWEVNGGFMTGSDFAINGNQLVALPTRDAFIAIMASMVAAVESGVTVSALFDKFSKRYTQAGLLNEIPVGVSKRIMARFEGDSNIARRELAKFFNEDLGFGGIRSVNTLDGVRITFDNGDVAHMRPSGNAPQLRIYSVAGSQERADEIVAMALAEPDGIFRTLERSLADAP